MKKIIEGYIPLADMIAETFGPDCEVVLHDLADPQHSVVYVANNQVTGREIGGSFDLLVKEVMLSPKLKENYVANYFFKAPNGHAIRSSTLLLKDEEGKVQGALCINNDISRFYKEMEYLKYFLPGMENTNALQESDTDGNVAQMVTGLIDDIMGDIDVKQMNRENRIEKIRFMDNKGIFLMKGAVELVAEKLEVKVVTVYSYLDEVRGKR